MHDFITAYGRDAARRGTLRIFYLRIGDTTVAVQMAILHANRLWCIKQGYDERFAQCAPGVILTHEMLRYACEQKLEACEFLGSAEDWQRRWPIQLRHYTNVRLYPYSFYGALALCLDMSTHSLQTVKKILAGFSPLRIRPA
jgi:CelD/BcsL family acetyltransferase involved in cellulose biosynthesis